MIEPRWLFPQATHPENYPPAHRSFHSTVDSFFFLPLSYNAVHVYYIFIVKTKNYYILRDTLLKFFPFRFRLLLALYILDLKKKEKMVVSTESASGPPKSRKKRPAGSKSRRSSSSSSSCSSSADKQPEAYLYDQPRNIAESLQVVNEEDHLYDVVKPRGELVGDQQNTYQNLVMSSDSRAVYQNMDDM